MQKKTMLGKGLADLLQQSAARSTPVFDKTHATALTPPREEFTKLPLNLLQRGKYQPRLDMHPESLQELADSIKVQGVIQPIVVRPIVVPGPNDSQRYEIIAGERRWHAAQIAGLSEIPAVIRHIPDEAAIAVSLIENIQRENLNPLEEARALQRLITEFKLTHQQAAQAIGRSRASISNLLRLLELTPDVSQFLEKRMIEMGHARALLALTDRGQQAEVAAIVAKKCLSVRETERLVTRLKRGGSLVAETVTRDPNVQRLEHALADALKTGVAIRHSADGTGKLVVDYNSLDEIEIDAILARLLSRH
jgi:ParB family transcriptional regulator, chromosome partitioning protein